MQCELSSQIDEGHSRLCQGVGKSLWPPGSLGHELQLAIELIDRSLHGSEPIDLMKAKTLIDETIEDSPLERSPRFPYLRLDQAEPGYPIDLGVEDRIAVDDSHDPIDQLSLRGFREKKHQKESAQKDGSREWRWHVMQGMTTASGGSCGAHHRSNPLPPATIGNLSGKLEIVATPIGNLADLSDRAREALASADLIACEDTRRTGRLMASLGLHKRLLSVHEHNERQRLPSLIDALERGDRIALVSDAGTPLLSDPGFLLVREAVARGIAVQALPGPSAALCALVVSGLPPLPFTFAGFVPPKSGKRKRFYGRFGELDHTFVVFESPHRIVASLEDAHGVLGARPAALARELTKLHEEVVRGSLGEILEEMRARSSIKGEIVLVVGSAVAGID